MLRSQFSTKLMSRIFTAFLIILTVLMLIYVLPSPLRAAETPGVYDESFNPSLIYKDFAFSHDLLGVGVYDSKWEQYLYGYNIDAELSVPGVSKLILLHLISQEFSPDDLIAISSRAAVADRYLAADPPGDVRLSGGQQFPVQYLVYRMLFYSSDGATIALTEALAQTEESGIQLINETAEDMGLKNTKITTLRSNTTLGNDSSEQEKDNIQNTSSISDLIQIMLNFHNNAQAGNWLSTFETFLTINVETQLLVSVRSPIYRLWSLSEGQVSQAYNAQGDTSLTLTSGTTKEGFPIITASIAAGKNNMIQDTTRLYGAIDSFYESTPLVTAGEKMQGIRERAENGDIFELVYQETINYLHPEDDLFLTQEIQYQGDPPYLLPLTTGTITGKAVFTLKNGMKIAANVGPDRDILASRSQMALFLHNLSKNPNLARVIFLLVILLIVILVITLLRNLLRIYYYLRMIRSSKRKN